jgi:hypothetical protein
LIQEEKTKQLSTSEKKPLRFIEKIETIDHTKQLQTAPTQTEVSIKILGINILYFY